MNAIALKNAQDQYSDMAKLPCSCSGPMDEEGLLVEHQCDRCRTMMMLALMIMRLRDDIKAESKRAGNTG